MTFRIVVVGMLACILAVTSVFAQNPPPAPTNLTARVEQPSPAMFASVKLEWQMVAGMYAFRVYRSIDDTTHFAPIASGVRDRMFRDYHVQAGRQYFYYVTAFALNTITPESPRSNIASVTIPPPPPRIRGFVSGTVVDDSTSAPLRRVRIKFFRLTAGALHGPATMTDSLGQYRAVLDSGRYIIRAEALCTSLAGCYYPEYYDNVREPSQATVVTVGDSTEFVANFGLSRMRPPSYSTITGTVTDTLGNPIRRASVAILRTLQNMNVLAASGWDFRGESGDIEGVGHTRGVVWHGYTDSNGTYTARVVSGRYIALASKLGYIPEFFNNKPTAQLADIINATQDTSGVDFSLAVRPLPQNSISGVVRDSLGTTVPSRIALYPAGRHPVGMRVRYGHTDSLGTYTISNVPEGKYFVLAMPFQGYAPAFFKAGAYGVRRRDEADTVLISGTVTGIDIGVRPVSGSGAVQVRGIIRNTSGQPIAGVTVIATAASGEVAGFGFTEPNGTYELEDVASGILNLTLDGEGYRNQSATVNVPSSTYTMSNVNFTMSPAGVTSVGPVNGDVPSAFALSQNYPNPFNPSTKIDFALTLPGMTTLVVYNMLGQEVASLVKEELKAGSYSVTFDAANLSSGLYFYKLTSGSYSATRKMILTK